MNASESFFDGPPTDAKNPAEEYLYNLIWKKSDGISDIDDMNPHLLLCLIFTWVICFVCLIKGIRSAGKVV